MIAVFISILIAGSFYFLSWTRLSLQKLTEKRDFDYQKVRENLDLDLTHITAVFGTQNKITTTYHDIWIELRKFLRQNNSDDFDLPARENALLEFLKINDPIKMNSAFQIFEKLNQIIPGARAIISI